MGVFTDLLDIFGVGLWRILRVADPQKICEVHSGHDNKGNS